MTERKKISHQETREQLRKKKLSAIEPITKSHIRVRNKSELAEIVEGPLLLSHEILFDKNIQTFMSSANRGVLVGEHPTADFSINFDALSESNKEVARKLVEEKVGELIPGIDVFPSRLNIDIPVSTESTWGEIEDVAVKVVNRFVAQRYMPEAYSPEFMLRRFDYALNEDIEGDTVPPEYFERHGFFYDDKSGLFFLSKDEIEKLYQTVDKENPNEPPKFSKIY